MATKLIHNAFYQLSGEKLRYAEGGSSQFLFAKANDGNFTVLQYLVAHNHIYRLVTDNTGKLEWRATDYSVRDLQPIQ